MECAVFDTWVDRKNGAKMHFDIIVSTKTTQETVLEYGRKYLEQKQEAGQPINAKNCSFCHIELANSDVEKSILEKGYFILEMQGCN